MACNTSPRAIPTPPPVIPSEAEGSGLVSKDSSAALCSARNDNKRKSGWSPERRARQAARIRVWAPWARSTGPKTAAGKVKSAGNSYKHGRRDRNMRLISKALSAQSRFLRGVNLYIYARTQNPANELLDRWGRRLVLEGRIVSATLDHALLTAGFTQEWRYGPYLPRKFHQNR